jgi:dTDP-4-dehydrorhamnose 3,5-epimerase
MRTLPTRLDGPLLIEPQVHGDDRGFFAETYRRSALAELGVREEMVQDNHSRSRRGVVRGLHFQIGRGASKLVRCASGEIYDVVVDLRRDSPTYRQWEGFPLSEENMHILYVPVGFGHGFCVVSPQADVIYKQSNYYSADVEREVRYNDPDIGVEWPPGLELLPSDRDKRAPLLRDVTDSLHFELPADVRDPE